MRSSRQEYWEWVAMLSSRHLPVAGIKPTSPALQVNSLPTEPPTAFQLKKQTNKQTNPWYHIKSA